MHQEIPILYGDDRVLAVVKPAGLLVHKTKLDAHESDNLVDRLYHQLGSPVFPVHRLDKPTSGILLLARDRDCASRLAQQFEQQLIKKSYLAVVRGYAAAEGHIDHAIADKDAKHKPRVPSVTRFRTLATIELPYQVDRYPTSRYSLTEVSPVTGRRHQIRQHMKHVNHPLIGDTSYGKTIHNRFFEKYFSCNRLLLHAMELSFYHPFENQQMSLRIDATDSTVADGGQFKRVLNDHRWQCIDDDSFE